VLTGAHSGDVYAACSRAAGKTLHAYAVALHIGLPSDVRFGLERQYREIEFDYKELRRLRWGATPRDVVETPDTVTTPPPSSDHDALESWDDDGGLGRRQSDSEEPAQALVLGASAHGRGSQSPESERRVTPGLAMLHDFIIANRDDIIVRARQRARLRTTARLPEATLEHGIPLFLSQLVTVLAYAEKDRPLESASELSAHRRITHSSELHGEDMLRNGFSVAQVVHGYGDVCQVVTELAGEMDAAIAAEDFQVFNRCLDDAIAGAVTAYGREREQDLADEGTERLGVFAHELRNLLGTAMLSFDVLKKGMVGVGGSTGAIHSRSLSRLHALIERSLAEVRLDAGEPKRERISLLDFLAEVEVTAMLQVDAHPRELHLSVVSPDQDATIVADRQLLTSAVSNLLQNAFKFTHAHGNVSLTTELTNTRVLIDVRDECGGLPPGKAEELFRPFVQAASDRSGLGLGLSIALRAVRANSGELRVRDIPGQGCAFTIDLPRAPQTSIPDLG
jgi:signal transduction histidine kinase